MQQQSSQQCQRPKLVWVITIFFAVSAIWTLLSFYLLYSGWLPLNGPQKAYFESLTLVDHTFTVLGASLNLVAAGALFLMRKLTPYLFTANLPLGVLVLLWHTATKGWVAAIGGAGLIGALIQPC